MTAKTLIILGASGIVAAGAGLYAVHQWQAQAAANGAPGVIRSFINRGQNFNHPGGLLNNMMHAMKQFFPGSSPSTVLNNMPQLTGGANTVSPSSVEALTGIGEKGAVINRAANTVTYTGSSVVLVALAGPAGAPSTRWEIDGLINPTIHIRAGAQVTVDLINTDSDAMHGFELTTTAPPYRTRTMLATQPIFMLMPESPTASQTPTQPRYPEETGQFTASPGHYYYLCQVPGHAADGMWGSLIVGS